MLSPLTLATQLADRCTAQTADSGTVAQELNWLREAGLLRVVLPLSQGGLGWGGEPGTWILLLRLLKTVGRGNLSLGRIYEGHVNAWQLVHQWGDAPQVEAVAATVRAGGILGVWNTEAPGDGLSLVAQPGGAFQLRGAKTFASGASHLARVFANARDPSGGWRMCLVPLARVSVCPDQGSWQPLGMQASESIRVDFTGVEVEGDCLFGRDGDYVQEPWFSGGAIRFAAVQLGGAEAVAEAARSFLQAHGRCDDPYQAMRGGETAALLETGNLWLEGAARRAERAREQPEELIAYAGLMRRTIERIGLEVMELAVRSTGSRALLRPLPLERLVRDLTMYLRQPAPDEVLARSGRMANHSPRHYDELWR